MSCLLGARVIAILVILMSFLRSLTFMPKFLYYEDYLYTDEARLFVNFSMVFLLLYFLLRCPDFSKALASTGFKRVYFGRFRMHETFLGILFVIGGIILIINGDVAISQTWYFERMAGLLPLLLGVFLIGRDWKDFAQGKFLSD